MKQTSIDPKLLNISPLISAQLSAVLELDRQALGGFWSADAYQREIDSPNSDLLILTPHSPLPTPHPSCPILGIGCLWAILEEAHITTLAIDPHFQGQGLGQALLYALLVAAHQRHLEWATLEVRVSNQVAIALYEKFGFTQVGTRKNYYPDGENALILWRKGIHQPEFVEQLAIWKLAVHERLMRSNWCLSEVHSTL